MLPTSPASIPESFFFFSSRRRHTRLVGDWSDVCSSDLHAMVKGRAQAFGARDVGGAELAAFLVVPEDRVLQLVAMVLDERADAVLIGEPAQRFEGLGGAREIGLG